ncbi:hypothetical protein CK203_074805 [Vitis vinifera]|uniref:Mre11 DNA-binding domain-containing protein n=1 Tax=Vitis vinifera TaxID=29760 RepID=A0A438DLZ5_VITVI|nr:hypothetical protein CK203_074805 [Vitis vinifera]
MLLSCLNLPLTVSAFLFYLTGRLLWIYDNKSSRFGQKYVGKVANPQDILIFTKASRKGRSEVLAWILAYLLKFKPEYILEGLVGNGLIQAHLEGDPDSSQGSLLEQLKPDPEIKA